MVGHDEAQLEMPRCFLNCKHDYASFFLIGITYSFLVFHNKTSHYFALKVPSVCAKTTGVSDAQKTAFKAGFIVSSILGIFTALFLSFLMEKHNCHKLMLLLACAITLIVQVSAIVMDLKVLDANRQYFNPKAIVTICRKFSEKSSLITTVLAISNFFYNMATLLIYSTSHSHIHYSIDRKRSFLYLSIFMGYAAQFLLQFILHFIANSVTNSLEAYHKIVWIVDMILPVIGTLVSVPLIFAMTVIKIDSKKPNICKRYRKHVFVRRTAWISLYCFTMLILTINYVPHTLKMGEKYKHVVEESGRFVGNAIFILLSLASLRLRCAAVAIDVLVLLLGVVTISLSILSYSASFQSTLNDIKSYVLIFVQSMIMRYLALHGLVTVLNLIVTEKYPSDVIAFAVAFIAISGLIPFGLLSTVKSEEFYISSRVVCFVFILIFIILKYWKGN
ncbi:MAG: hypothetical protein MHMPM18_002050 [Marteilia pararefringens]